MINNTNRFIHDTDNCCLILSNNKLLKAKDFRNLITKLNFTEPCAKAFWKHKYNIELEKDHWTMATKITRESRIQEISWKILHNIYPTQILLKKIKIADTEFCKFCPTEIDYIEHFFVKCKKINILYKLIEEKVLKKFGYNLKLAETEALLGIVDNSKGTKEMRNYANLLILIAKVCVGIYKYNKQTEITLLFEREIRKRKIE